MKSDDLAQAIVRLLLHRKSGEANHNKFKKMNSPNVYEHIDTQGDSRVCCTVYSVCPIKQFSIAFSRSRLQ
jgi:hypothetical protein